MASFRSEIKINSTTLTELLKKGDYQMVIFGLYDGTVAPDEEFLTHFTHLLDTSDSIDPAICDDPMFRIRLYFSIVYTIRHFDRPTSPAFLEAVEKARQVLHDLCEKSNEAEMERVKNLPKTTVFRPLQTRNFGGN